MSNMKITMDKSMRNFLWDIFIRSFECKDALYEDCSVLSDEEKSTLVESYNEDFLTSCTFIRSDLSLFKTETEHSLELLLLLTTLLFPILLIISQLYCNVMKSRIQRKVTKS